MASEVHRMSKSENQKIKILYLARMLADETDEERGLTMAQIIEKLAAEGISAERKAIYRDIDALRDFGMEIETMRRPKTEYYLANREFEIGELLLMADAIQSSRFLTQTQAKRLAKRLQTLTSEHQRWQLEGSIHVKDRIKKESESAFSNVDAIRAALTQKRRIEFHYFEYDLSGRKRLRKDGKTYVETPVSLVYSNGLYYLITFNETHDDFTTYRVDRMTDVAVSDKPAQRNERIANYDVEKFEERSFGMYAGYSVAATVIVTQDALSSVIDRFSAGPLSGMTVKQHDDTHAKIHAHLIESPVFYGWLAQFGDSVVIDAPKGLAQRYRDHLEKALAPYQS